MWRDSGLTAGNDDEVTFVFLHRKNAKREDAPKV